MKSLVGIRTNIYYTKDGEEETKHHEIVLLLDKAEYTRTNAGEIIRQRGIKEERFTVTDKGLDSVIETLKAIKDAKEEDLS